MKVGDKCWSFWRDDPEYRRTRNLSDAIQEREVIGETRTSWIIGYPGGREIDKIDKKTMKTRHRQNWGYGDTKYYFSEQERNDYIWKEHNRHKLSEAVRACDNIDLLKQIAELINYEPIWADTHPGATKG